MPIIMFGATAERWRIAEAKRLGVNVYLTMPISAKTLLDRILSLVAKPLVAKPRAAIEPTSAFEPAGDRGQDPKLFMV